VRFALENGDGRTDGGIVYIKADKNHKNVDSGYSVPELKRELKLPPKFTAKIRL
jgi:hypothetical protein